jgi:hypothetical protein
MSGGYWRMRMEWVRVRKRTWKCGCSAKVEGDSTTARFCVEHTPQEVASGMWGVYDRSPVGSFMQRYPTPNIDIEWAN